MIASSAANPSSAPRRADRRVGTPTARQGAPNQAGAQQELARALDRFADRLNSSMRRKTMSRGR